MDMVKEADEGDEYLKNLMEGDDELYRLLNIDIKEPSKAEKSNTNMDETSGKGNKHPGDRMANRDKVGMASGEG